MSQRKYYAYSASVCDSTGALHELDDIIADSAMMARCIVRNRDSVAGKLFSATGRPIHRRPAIGVHMYDYDNGFITITLKGDANYND